MGLDQGGRLFRPSRVQISAPVVQDQLLRPAVAVGHEGDLRVKSLKKGNRERSPEISHSSGRLSARTGDRLL